MSGHHQSGGQGFDPYLAWLGIAPHEHPIDHYRLLGVRRFEADPEFIAAAADERMRLVRQQQTGPRGAYTQRLLNEISAARLCLLDPHARSAYDAALEQRISVAPTMQSAAMNSPGDEAAGSPPMAAREEVEVECVGARPLRTTALSAISVVAIASLVWAGSLIWLPRPPAAAPPTSPPSENLSAVEVDPLPLAEQRPAILDNVDVADAPVMNQEATGEIHLPAQAALIQGRTARCESRGDVSLIVDWSAAGDQLLWRFNVTRPGVFRVELTYSAPPKSAGGRYLLTIGEQEKAAGVRSGASAEELVTDFYFLAVRRAGENTLVMRPLEIRAGELMKLQAVRLIPQYSLGG